MCGSAGTTELPKLETGFAKLESGFAKLESGFAKLEYRFMKKCLPWTAVACGRVGSSSSFDALTLISLI